MITESAIELALNYNYIIPVDMNVGINLFGGIKVLLFSAFVKNDCTEIASIFAIECDPEEPNAPHQKECSNFLVTCNPKIYLRSSLDDAMEIIEVLKFVNKFTIPNLTVNLKDAAF